MTKPASSGAEGGPSRAEKELREALAVEQEFVNLGTTPVNFDFYLYAPDADTAAAMADGRGLTAARPPTTSRHHPHTPRELQSRAG